MANPTAGVPIATTPFDGAITRRDLAATAQTYYVGEAIGLDSSGNATKCDDTAAVKFDGFYASGTGGPRTTVESGDAAGDKHVYTQRPRYAVVKHGGSPAAGDEGKPVWWTYSNEVSYFPGTYRNFAGWVHRYVSSTEVEIELAPRSGPELVQATLLYDANSVDRAFFVADRAYRVVDIRGRVDVVGTDAGAVTAAIKKAASGTAVASGTALHSGTFNLKGTDDTNQALTLSTTSSDLDIAEGTCIGVDFTGTLTAAVGAITVLLCPVGR